MSSQGGPAGPRAVRGRRAREVGGGRRVRLSHRLSAAAGYCVFRAGGSTHPWLESFFSSFLVTLEMVFFGLTCCVTRLEFRAR